MSITCGDKFDDRALLATILLAGCGEYSLGKAWEEATELQELAQEARKEHAEASIGKLQAGFHCTPNMEEPGGSTDV
jgi:hypothetical protein